MKDLEEAFALLDEHADDGDFVGAQPEGIVRAAEATLGLTFPPTYRRFVLAHGAGSIWGEEFYGVVGHDTLESTAPSAVGLTLKARERHVLPPWLIHVGEAGDGMRYVIDTSQMSPNGEAPVGVYHPGQRTGQVAEVIAEDFGQFLLRRLHAGLEWAQLVDDQDYDSVEELPWTKGHG